MRHDPGHAQVDFGEALAWIGSVEQKIHFFAMDLAQSDSCLVHDLPGGEQRGLLRNSASASSSSARAR